MIERRHEDCARSLTHRLFEEQPIESAPSKGITGAFRKLIISTGDVSDIDGLLALAEYARTGSDVLFITNYPAYVGVEENDVDASYAESNPGLGYRYSAKEVLESEQVPNHLLESYTHFLS